MITRILLRKFGICVSLITALALVAFAGSGSARAAATLTVCPSGCTYSQIGPAVAAAKNGDTIMIRRGSFQGGITIDKSLKLVGAGARKTIIRGGGPVLTVGTFGEASEPTVSIRGVTITGGVTRSDPASVPCAGKEGVVAAGGGIEVPAGTDPGGACDRNDFGGGATVTITNSVITGNRVAPSDTVSGFFPIPAAWAFGGGIDTSGSLTLANTTVSENHVGSASGLSVLATFAEGAGIFSGTGDMTITNGTVSGNQAAVTGPGVIADGAGMVSNGTFSMGHSSVTDNSATVSAEFFGFVPVGGLHVQNQAQGVSISNSTISGNAATVTQSGPDNVGAAGAQGGALKIDIDDSNVRLSNDTISDNSVRVATLPGSTADAFGWGGVGEIGGTLSNVRITGNSLDVSSAAGNVQALGGASPFDEGTISNSLIGNNHVHVSAPLGSVDISGGGLDVFGPTTLRNSTVSGNTVDASGKSGSARGGGIADIAFPFAPREGPPGGPLALQNSSVTANTLSGAGLTLQGGGIYLQGEPITLTNSVIATNIPDQCFGC